MIKSSTLWVGTCPIEKQLVGRSYVNPNTHAIPLGNQTSPPLELHKRRAELESLNTLILRTAVLSGSVTFDLYYFCALKSYLLFSKSLCEPLFLSLDKKLKSPETSNPESSHGQRSHTVANRAAHSRSSHAGRAISPLHR